MLNKWLSFSIIVLGAMYIFSISTGSTVMNLALKLTLMTMILIYAVIGSQNNDRFTWVMIIGLIFCMLGNFLVKWFNIGLTTLIIGHLLYTGGFLTRWNFSWFRFFSIIPIALYSSIYGYILVASLHFKEEEPLVSPIILYIIVISMMYWFSIMTRNKWAILGCTLFVISDSVFSWNLIVSNISYSTEITMITYLGAQFLIAKAIHPSAVVPAKSMVPLNMLQSK